MTVNTANITSGPYLGNDIVDTFDYTFRIEDKTQVTVYETNALGVQTTLIVDTDYTVTGIGVDAGGQITRVAGALPTGYTWYIRSNYSATQLTAFASQGGFFPDVHEDAFDKLTFLIQQLLDGESRTFKLASSIDIDGTFTLSEDAASRAGKIAGFDTSGDLTIVTLNTDFLSKYLGAKTANPTLDDQGNPLIDGALYYNTKSNVIRVYDLGTTTWLTVNPSNQASDINVVDAAAHYVGGDVETILAELWSLFANLVTLASTANGDGASLVGVEDALGYFTGADVESVLAELYASGLIQEVTASSSTYIAPFTTAIALDDTVPLITEGTELLTIAITPGFASSVLEFDVEFTCGTSTATGNTVVYSLIDVTAGTTLHTWVSTTKLNSEPETMQGSCSVPSPGISSNTYSLRAGTVTGTLEINGVAGARVFGGALSTKIRVREVK